MLFVPTILLALLQLFLAVLLLRVYLISSNKKQVLSLIFVVLAFTAWTIVNSLLLQDVSDSSEIARLDVLNSLGFMLGGLSVVQIVSFSETYPVETVSSKRNRLLKVALYLFAIISYHKIFAGYNEFNDATKELTYVDGSLGLFYVLFILFCILMFVRNVRQSVKRAPHVSQQAKTLVVGLVLTAVHGLFFIILVPLLFGQKDLFYVLGYISPVYLVGFTSYSLLRQQLFDFRTVAARAAAYIFTSSFVVLIYVTFAYGLRSFVISDFKIDKNQFISNIILTTILIFIYPIIKTRFDKITNRIFFRDAYDPQVFLDELNKVLVGNLEIDNLLRKSSKIIETSLKAQFCSFFIRDTAYFKSRLIGDYDSKLSSQEVERIHLLIPKIKKKIVLADDNPTTEEEKELIKILKANNIEALVRIVSTLEFEVAGIGYLLVGSKRNGNLYTKQDLKVLEIVANELVIAIENALRFEEIEQFNVTLQKKIDDATKELKQSNEKLKALDEAKDEFVSMASHQLRTPLTSIKGYISMVVEGDAGEINDTQKQMLGQALFSSQRMVYLISDLLNVSRLKTGKFIIEQKPVYLPDLVESEMQQLHEGAQAKNITLSYIKPKKFPTLNLDDMKIRQVVMNFTDNAIYYTPAGGKITVALKDKKDSVEFTVKDTGIGVPKEERHKLFVKFYRAENARKARPDGTGLGLFMAKKVIVAQGGSIIFDSKEGKGSTFGFSFPKARLLVPEDTATDQG